MRLINIINKIFDSQILDIIFFIIIIKKFVFGVSGDLEFKKCECIPNEDKKTLLKLNLANAIVSNAFIILAAFAIVFRFQGSRHEYIRFFINTRIILILCICFYIFYYSYLLNYTNKLKDNNCICNRNWQNNNMKELLFYDYIIVIILVFMIIYVIISPPF
jgi:hypothetical protein